MQSVIVSISVSAQMTTSATSGGVVHMLPRMRMRVHGVELTGHGFMAGHGERGAGLREVAWATLRGREAEVEAP